MKRNIIVLGHGGQLGSELADISTKHNIVFVTFEEVDVTDPEALQNTLSKGWDFCINASAYTAVDLAETEREIAYKVNATAVENMAKLCNKYEIDFIHISTDYVFNGQGTRPYLEKDPTDPVNYYGESKLKGEEFALENQPNTYIIRTSWVYSTYGKNFVKTMLNLAATRTELNVVGDQVGAPTYARDLARAIFKIIDLDNKKYGIYHYSNAGITNWAEFAQTIFDIRKLPVKVNPITTAEYPTPAKRPSYSCMNINKIQETFGIKIPGWKTSLEEMLEKYEG